MSASTFSRFKTLCAVTLVACAALGAPAARAACTGIGVFSCSSTVSVALPLSFGNYNPGSAQTGSTDISVTGTVYGVGILVTLSYAISLNAGTGGTVANRVLNGPGSTPLAYNLYTTDTYQAVWGDSGRSDSYSLLASVGGVSLTRPYTAYGLIPAGQYVTAGSYSNTIMVSVLY